MMKKIINISAIFAPIALIAINATPVQSASMVKLEVDLDLLTDNFGSETSFEMFDTSDPGTNIAFDSFSPPDSDLDDGFANSGDFSGNDNTEYTFTWQLDPGDYEFTISDSFGDGICCDDGEGNYTLTTPNEVIPSPSGGEFGNSETVAFTIIPVPESSTLGMLALLAGVGGVSAMQRRHRKNKLKSTTFTCSINQK